MNLPPIHLIFNDDGFLPQKLGFELGAPLSIHFLRRYSKAAQSNTDTHIMAKYFLELSTVEYKMCAYHPSEVGHCQRSNYDRKPLETLS